MINLVNVILMPDEPALCMYVFIELLISITTYVKSWSTFKSLVQDRNLKWLYWPGSEEELFCRRHDLYDYKVTQYI